MTARPELPPAIFLLGPTASGKTQLALELHERQPVELISVDSAQVYRGLDIGSGKPDAATLERHPHRLIDIRDPAEPYSAADFRRDALQAMHEVSAAGRIPLLVGGTMLYFKALRDGLADLPEADPALRARLEAQAREEGLPALHRRLREVDPESAARIRPGDPQRLLRALEVWELSGRPLSELHRAQTPQPLPFRLRQFALLPERADLHARIELRLRDMLARGFVDEVARLHARGDLHLGLPAVRSVGYRQIWDFLEGRDDYPGMVDKALAATRQLAKRQVTWLRGWEQLELLEPGQRPAL